MGYFRGFYEKKSKKIDTYFGNHDVHQNAQSNFKCLSSQPKLGQNQHFFEGKMTGNLQGNDHSFHLTSWTHILAKKWLPQRGKWKKMHFSKNHQFFTVILTSLQIWLKIQVQKDFRDVQQAWGAQLRSIGSVWMVFTTFKCFFIYSVHFIVVFMDQFEGNYGKFPQNNIFKGCYSRI